MLQTYSLSLSMFKVWVTLISESFGSTRHIVIVAKNWGEILIIHKSIFETYFKLNFPFPQQM